MPNLRRRELTALENSFLDLEGLSALDNILLNPDDLLRSRGHGQGLQLYTYLLHDPHNWAEMRTLASTVIREEWEVLPAGTSKPEEKAADLVREQLLNLNTQDVNPREENQSSVRGFDQVQQSFLIGGVLHGYHCGEVMWRSEGAETIAAEIRSRDPRQFLFARGKHGYVVRHITREHPLEGEELPTKKILCFSNGAIDGNPYGYPVGRTIFWPTFFKRKGVNFWLKFVERFASPKPVGKFPRGSTEEQKAALKQALRDLTQDSEAVIPETMIIEYLEAAQGGAIDSYESLVRFLDQQISQAILGQTGTSDQSSSGGSRARDQVADDQKRDIAKALSDNLSITFNRLARWITEYNMPGVAAPTIWRSFDDQEDLNSRASRDKTLFDMGYRLNAEGVELIYGENYEEAVAEGEEPALIGTLGVGGTQALTGLLAQAATGQIPKENAIATLVTVFGINRKSAAAMVPEKQEEPEEQGGLASLFGNAPKKENAPKKGEEPLEQDAEFAEEDDDFQQLIDRARPDILAAMAPLVDSVGGLVAGADSLEEIREGLVELYPQLAIADFAEVLGQVMQISDLVARDEVLGAEASFTEALESAVAGTLDFAGKKKKKGPNCTPGKSHFCRTPTGRGSCVSASKRCRYKPDGVAKAAADYTGKQTQYKNAAALDKAAKKEGKGGDLAPSTGGSVVAPEENKANSGASAKNSRELIDDQYSGPFVTEEQAREWLDARLVNDYQLTDENIELRTAAKLRNDAGTDAAALDDGVKNNAEKRIKDRESFATVKTQFQDFHYNKLDTRAGGKNVAATEEYWLRSIAIGYLSDQDREKLNNTINRGKASQKTIDKAKKKLAKDDTARAEDKSRAKKLAKQHKDYLDLDDAGKREFWRNKFDEEAANQRTELEDTIKGLNSKNGSNKQAKASLKAEAEILDSVGAKMFDENLESYSNEERAKSYLSLAGNGEKLRKAFGGISFKDSQDKSKVKRMYRKLAQTAHPDAGGTQEEFLQLTELYEQVLRDAY